MVSYRDVLYDRGAPFKVCPISFRLAAVRQFILLHLYVAIPRYMRLGEQYARRNNIKQ